MATKETKKFDLASVIDKLKPGTTVKIHQKIKELNAQGEEKERIQIFEGIILAHRSGKEINATITVRKISNGFGVEKIYPIFSPTIVNIELVKKTDTTKAKLYYLRSYRKKLKEKIIK
ncbi:MAG: 50S ribosomal protein L19 [Candidatus Buchananbacteria bacterium]